MFVNTTPTALHKIPFIHWKSSILWIRLLQYLRVQSFLITPKNMNFAENYNFDGFMHNCSFLLDKMGENLETLGVSFNFILHFLIFFVQCSRILFWRVYDLGEIFLYCYIKFALKYFCFVCFTLLQIQNLRSFLACKLPDVFN